MVMSLCLMDGKGYMEGEVSCLHVGLQLWHLHQIIRDRKPVGYGGWTNGMILALAFISPLILHIMSCRSSSLYEIER